MIESEYSNEYCEKCISLEKKSLELCNISSELLEEKAKLTYEYLETKSIADSRGFWMWLWFSLFVIVVLLPKANAQEPPITCARAELSYQPPTTRLNGDALTIDELDYYVIRVFDVATGETTEYILDKYNVVDANGPVNERTYSTKENQSMPLRVGRQGFEIKVVDTDGLSSPWSDRVFKTLCAYNGGIDLKIKIGVGDGK